MSVGPICDRVNTYVNKSRVIPGYEGIPYNLLLNVIGWVVLMSGFTILRKLAWDYGRMAMVQPRKNRWTGIFSEAGGGISDCGSVESEEQNLPANDPGYLTWIINYFKLTTGDLQSKAGIDAVQYLRFHLYLIIYTAITTVFCLVVILPVNIHGTLKSPDLQKFGVTTISNISANSSSLWVHTIFGIGFFLLAFFLMQHFSRQFRRESTRTPNFSEKTLMISGISRTNCSRALILRHFTELYPECPVEDVQICYDTRKLIKLENQRDSVRAALRYSKESYTCKGQRPLIIPRCCGWMYKKCYQNNCCRSCCWKNNNDVVDTSSSLNYISNGITNNNNNSDTTDGIPWSETPDAVPARNYNKCSLCFCCPCPPAVDAINYYSDRKMHIQEEIEKQYETTIKRPIGIAFVTFSTKYAAAYVCKEYRNTCRRLITSMISSTSSALKSHQWSVDFAPVPSNIIWGNLAATRIVWWCRAIIINLCVFIVVFFLTTPTYVLNLINTLHLTERLQINNPLLIQFIPSIILWSVSALLPYIVFNSDRLVGHWTKSVLHLTVMIKTYTLLILMILILPSLGLTSIPALLQWLFPEMHLIPIVPSNRSRSIETNFNLTMFSSSGFNEDTSPFIPIGPQSFQWECVFMPDNGAFFVNYVITAAFIGTSLELVRFSELLNYTCRLMCIKSRAEKAGVRKASQFEFEFGLFYAWSLCVFSVISAYSILCPLITPFGLIYLIFKYFVERYNLYYAYLPSRIDSHIHWLATSCMLASVFLLQLNIFMFIVLRSNTVSHALVICSLLGLIFSAILMIFTVVTGWIMAGSSSARKHLLRNARLVSVIDDGFSDHHQQHHRSRLSSVSSVQHSELHLNDITNTNVGRKLEVDGVPPMRRNNSDPNQYIQPFTEALQQDMNLKISLPSSPLRTVPSSSLQVFNRQDFTRHSFPVRTNNNEQFVAPILLYVQKRHSVAQYSSTHSIISALSQDSPNNHSPQEYHNT
ncbi:CSC1-like protein [Schistosoma japonicum]|uniref:CSC1-like protein n=2 Tax=Schistosoma japonicum TaxID=6182 RepID=A0A4Z2CP50_SCHJA|nr:CSC1-like protein [Schistosoma japonicum]